MEVGASGQFGGQTNGSPYIPGLTIQPSGTFELAGANLEYGNSYETIGSLTMYGGTVLLAGAFEPGFNGFGFGTNYGELDVAGPINIESSPYTSFITGHGKGWRGSSPGSQDTTNYQSSSLLLATATNVINVQSGGALLMDTPFTTGYFTGGGLQPIVYSPNTLIKTGTGLLWTTGTNTYAGNTYVQQGEWVVGGDTPFGSVYNATNATNIAIFYGLGYRDGPANNHVVVSTGATILAVSPFNCPVPLVLNGQGVNANAGALNITANGTRFSAGCTLGSDSWISVGSGDNLFFDDFDNTNGDAPPLAGSSTLYKQGSGDLLLYMSLPVAQPFPNEFSGPAIIADGTLELDGQNFIPMLLGPVTVGTNNTTTRAVLTLDTDWQLANNVAITINSGCELYNFAGVAPTLGSLTLNSGTVYGGTMILNGNISAQDVGGVYLPSIYSNLSLNGTNRTFNVATNSFLEMYGNVTDGGNHAGIIKTGPGELDFGGTNSCAGATMANTGRVGVFNSAAFSPTPAGGVVVSNGAELALYDGAKVGAAPLSLTGTGEDAFGALKGYGTNSWAGTITLAAFDPKARFAGGSSPGPLYIVNPRQRRRS